MLSLFLIQTLFLYFTSYVRLFKPVFSLSLSTRFVPFLPSNYYLVNLAFDACMVVTIFADWLATIHHQLSVYDRPTTGSPTILLASATFRLI